MSQLPTVHVPSVQVAVAWTRTHGAPQAPQLLGSFWVLVSQPSASLPLQFLKPVLHEPSTQAPAEHAAMAFVNEGQAVQNVALQP